MLNVSEPSQNNFEVVPGQEVLMAELDRKFPELEGCLIVAGDQMNQMINPLVYASLLLLNRMMEEKKDKATIAAVSRTSTTPSDEAEAAEQEAQKKMAAAYKAIGQDELQELLLDIANEDSFQIQDLMAMNQQQLQIFQDFFSLDWERIIDFAFLDQRETDESTTIINPQRFQINQMFVNNIIKVLALQDEQDDEIIEQSDSDASGLENEHTVSMKKHPVYIWAGYLPAGKQTILIYDK
jgi:hypothetical protein